VGALKGEHVDSGAAGRDVKEKSNIRLIKDDISKIIQVTAAV
jgi:hypothetical protein